MQKFYYATFKEAPCDIIAFQKERDRNEWVTFKDLISLMTGTSFENCFFTRISLTEYEATMILGNKLQCQDGFIDDEILSDAKWIFSDLPIPAINRILHII